MGEIFECMAKESNKDFEPKREKFIQIDFSATPYSVTGSGQKRINIFPILLLILTLKLPLAWLIKTIADRERSCHNETGFQGSPGR